MFIDYPSASRVAISYFDEIGMANVAVTFMGIVRLGIVRFAYESLIYGLVIL